ncbi:arylesterase [Sulfurimonas sp. C5]|uniref:arylesterase n=1 Tax=Sulfurimonas sp. C5 TaxID=3036947 RepID=UPI002454F8C9|nr:arylesterase [Sulfurimonas sp. C5]MDH4945086.1 arylesterase [Sulfurimonas sp. C5]
MNIIRLLFFPLVLLIILMIFVKNGDDTDKQPLSKESTILAFGDSLTAGYGASSGKDYPSQLQRLSGIKVINAGISGEVSADGLKRLPELLQQYKPQVVILCHGGNDILRKKSIHQLQENLRQMIVLAQNNGAEVLLVAVPNFGLLGLSPLSLYEVLADEYKLMFAEDVLSDVLGKNQLKSDTIHPNDKGYKVIAERFYKILSDEGLLK